MKTALNIMHKSSVTLMLLLFLGFYFSVTSFYHPHVINGRTVYHSHPFKKDKTDKTDKNTQPLHSHSTQDFNYVLGLDKSLWEDNLLVNLDFKRPYSLSNKIEIFDDSFAGVHTWFTILLRAPPASSRV